MILVSLVVLTNSEAQFFQNSILMPQMVPLPLNTFRSFPYIVGGTRALSKPTFTEVLQDAATSLM